MKKSNNNTLKELAYKEIKQMILLRDLQQGEKIYESDLAENMKTSRTPIREALMVLEKENLVENKGRIGYFVRRINAGEISDYFNIRQMLEQYIVPLIVANITDDEVEALEENVAKSKSCFEDGDFREFVLCNSQFHELLTMAAHSPISHCAISSLDDISILLRSMASKNQASVDEVLRDHKAIVENIKQKNSEKLREVLDRHLLSSKKRNMAYIDFIS